MNRRILWIFGIVLFLKYLVLWNKQYFLYILYVCLFRITLRCFMGGGRDIHPTQLFCKKIFTPITSHMSILRSPCLLILHLSPEESNCCSWFNYNHVSFFFLINVSFSFLLLFLVFFLSCFLLPEHKQRGTEWRAVLETNKIKERRKRISQRSNIIGTQKTRTNQKGYQNHNILYDSSNGDSLIDKTENPICLYLSPENISNFIMQDMNHLHK